MGDDSPIDWSYDQVWDRGRQLIGWLKRLSNVRWRVDIGRKSTGWLNSYPNVRCVMLDGRHSTGWLNSDLNLPTWGLMKEQIQIWKWEGEAWWKVSNWLIKLQCEGEMSNVWWEVLNRLIKLGSKSEVWNAPWEVQQVGENVRWGDVLMGDDSLNNQGEAFWGGSGRGEMAWL